MGTNRQIAKNTLIVYTQVFVTMVVGLLSSRIVLRSLGASDFGLYGVVGGVIAIFSFISGPLSQTTVRFLNYEMGRPGGNLNRIFNQSNLIHIIAALVLFILIETIGTIYILDYLNVAENKRADAMFVFQVSAVVACVGILNIPYRSVLMAQERFGILACIDIVNAVAKMLLVASLLFYKGNLLRFYSLSMGVITFISFIAYHWITITKWPKIVKWRIEKNISNYRELFSFAGWNFLSTLAILGRSQGAHLLFNLFFGTMVNAAYSLSLSVQGYVNVLAGNFNKVVTPKITKSVAESGLSLECMQLVCKSGRFSILLMELVFFPLFVEMGFVLHLWLGDSYPLEAVYFCRLTLFIAVLEATSGGLLPLINGLGRVKWFKIQQAFFFFFGLLVGYVLFQIGQDCYSILYVFMAADILNRSFQLFLLHRMFNFNIGRFIRETWGRPAVVFLIMMFYGWGYGRCGFYDNYSRMFGMVLTSIVTLFVIVLMGMKRNERCKICHKIVEKI